jgi:hypothetical protein
MTPARRLLLFGLLGPPLGFVTGFWVLLQILNMALGEKSTAELGQLGLLPMAYIVGIVPALATGGIDHYFRNWRLGPLFTCLAGYLLGFMPIAPALVMGFIHGPFVLIFGLIGAIPALICALIARMLNRDGRQ